MNGIPCPLLAVILHDGIRTSVVSVPQESLKICNDRGLDLVSDTNDQKHQTVNEGVNTLYNQLSHISL